MAPLHASNSTTVRSNIDAFAGERDRTATTASEHQAAPASPVEPPTSAVSAGERPTQAAWIRRDRRFTVLRTAMRALSFATPALAARLLDRIWFSAPRTSPPQAARTWVEAGTPLAFRVHDRHVAAWRWGSGPTVLLVHGWGGNAGQMHALAAPLLARGFSVVALDAPAHGRSGASRLGGRRVSMIEIAAAIRVVSAGVGPLAGLVAHSGGCTATGLALRDGWTGPERIAFIAPFALATEAIAPFGRALGAGAQVIARFRSGVERRFGRPWSDFDAPSLAGLRSVPPLLVVHDADDREVPPFHGDALAQGWPGARLHRTHGLGHRRVLRDTGVADAVARFFGTPSDAAATPARGTPADGRGELDRAFATCAEGSGTGVC